MNIQSEAIGFKTDLDHLEGVVTTQLFDHAIPALQQFFEFALRLFGQVEVWCVRGNHGDMGRFAAATTNWDDVCYYFLRQVFGHNNRIQFHIASQFYNVAQICGRKFMLIHGDKIPMHMTLPWYSLTTRSMRWQGAIGEYDYLCYGHFHSYSAIEWSGRMLFGNGTFLSDDEWTIKTIGLTSSVCQMLLGLHPKQGVSFIRKLQLE